MRRYLIIDNCPRCGRLHRYLLDVNVVEASETAVTSHAVTRNRLFECPDTQETFEHRFTLDEPPGTKILEVRVERSLGDGERTGLDLTDTQSRGSSRASRSSSPSSVREEEQRETKVFISYSRTDQRIVTPIAQILRAVGIGVFHDVDSIPFGKRWRPVIEDSIDRATIIVVFWCEHARGSAEVRKEWELALRSEKDVVPILLDGTPMEPELAEFQALDLRALVSSHVGVPVDAPGMFPDVSSHNPVLLPEVSKAIAARLLEFLAQR